MEDITLTEDEGFGSDANGSISLPPSPDIDADPRITITEDQDYLSNDVQILEPELSINNDNNDRNNENNKEMLKEKQNRVMDFFSRFKPSRKKGSDDASDTITPPVATSKTRTKFKDKAKGHDIKTPTQKRTRSGRITPKENEDEEMTYRSEDKEGTIQKKQKTKRSYARDNDEKIDLLNDFDTTSSIMVVNGAVTDNGITNGTQEEGTEEEEDVTGFSNDIEKEIIAIEDKERESEHKSDNVEDSIAIEPRTTTKAKDQDDEIFNNADSIVVEEEQEEVVRNDPIEIIDLDGDEEQEAQVQHPTTSKVKLKDILGGRKSINIADNSSSSDNNRKTAKSTPKKKTKESKSKSKPSRKIDTKSRKSQLAQEVVEILSDVEWEPPVDDDEELHEILIQLSEHEKEKNLKDLEKKIKDSMMQQQKDNKKEPNGNGLLGILGKKKQHQSNGEEKVDQDDAEDDNNRKNSSVNLMSILNSNRINYKNPIAKLKEIEPPFIPKDQMLVQPQEDKDNMLEYRSLSCGLEKRIPTITKSQDEQLEHFNFSIKTTTTTTTNKTSPSSEIIIQPSIYKTREDLLCKLSPAFHSDLRYNRLLRSLESQVPISNPLNSQLCDLYKPHRSDELLLSLRQVQTMKDWLRKSFKLLEKKNIKRPNLDRRSRTTVAAGEFDDFIVADRGGFPADYDLIETDDENEVYSPLMIIEGDVGIGKTTAIYTLLEDIGGYVHEINTSQARGRKDILAGLRESATTQLVHQSNTKEESSDFQKGVILFEDVDVLFEEEDKLFWSVIQEILQISRRPVVFTCTDIDRIPSVFIDTIDQDQALITLDPVPDDTLQGYLYLVGLNYGYVVDDDVINDIINAVEQYGGGLRGCLMELQRLLPQQNLQQRLLRVSKGSCPEQQQQWAVERTSIEESNLKHYANLINVRSYSDVFETSNSTPTFNEHDQPANEFQIYGHPFPDLTTTTTNTASTNITSCINTQQAIHLPDVTPHSLQSLKNTDYYYLISRIRRHLKRQTRSFHNNPNLEPTEESEYISIIQKMRPLEFSLDVSPAIREMARYEVRIRKYNEQVKEIKGYKKEQLMWGNFKDDPWEYLGPVFVKWKKM